jgi:ubiquinone/menaquinone biosynthesis C-methylase UbiE
MIPFKADGGLVGIIIRDVLMILGVGVLYSLYCMRAEGDFREFGLSLKRWYIALAINLVLATALAITFMRTSPLPEGFRFASHGGEIAYIMLAGIFECVVFYAFIQTAFTRSFGVIAGVIAAAFFYSLHHAGFQAEFVKLFFVGLLYAIPIAIGGNIMIIFPFFWGVGATWDVLVQSEAVTSIAYPWPRALILFTGIIIAAVITRITATPARVVEGGAILDSDEMTAEEYGTRMYDHLAGEYRRFAKSAIRALGLPEGASLLEIGPGPGWAGIELMKLRADVKITAIEASPDMIRAAEKNAIDAGCSERADYLEGVAEDLTRFAPRTFDAVISRDSLHHWTDPGAAFREIDRILKPSGRVFIVDGKRNQGLVENLVIRAVSRRIGKAMAAGWKDSIRASWTPAELREIFAANRLNRWTAWPVFLDLVIGLTPAPTRAANIQP